MKNYKSAKAEGIPTKKFVDRNSKNVEAVFKSISSSHDQFVRTVDSKKHWPGVQKLWKAISKDLYKKSYTAKYCVGCEKFLLDKEIVKGCCEIHPGKKLETISITFKVKILGPIKINVNRTGYRSIFGPVFESKTGKKFAIRFQGMDDVRVIEQWYKMIKMQLIM